MPSYVYIWMRIWVWAVLWACSTPAPSAYEEKLRVGVNATFCEHNESTLFCDYKTTDKSVYIDEELDSSVQKVFVVNAAKLQLSEGVCVNVTIVSVPDVEVVKSEGDPCGPRLKFSARLSTFDRLPSQFSHVELNFCSIFSLATCTNITNITVDNSNIKILDIACPLQQGSNLQILKTIVDSIGPRGLIIEGNVVLNESSITTSEEDNVTTLPAKLTLNSFSGNLEVMGVNSYNQGQHYEPCRSYFRAFVVCVTLVVLLLLVIIAGGIYIYRLKVQKCTCCLNENNNGAIVIDLPERDPERPQMDVVFTISTQVTP